MKRKPDFLTIISNPVATMRAMTICLMLLMLLTFVSPIAAQGTITTVAGGGPGCPGPIYDGCLATQASLIDPQAIATDRLGNLYIVDGPWIREMKPNGQMWKIAGGHQGFNGDHRVFTTAWLNHPTGIAVDQNLNIYIADSWNQRIRVINTSTTSAATVAGVTIPPLNIMTVAGNGSVCTIPTSPPPACGLGGPATSAQLDYPTGVAIDTSGNIYISEDDVNNPGIANVLMVNTSGTISEVQAPFLAAYIGAGSMDSNHGCLETNYRPECLYIATGNSGITNGSHHINPIVEGIASIPGVGFFDTGFGVGVIGNGCISQTDSLGDGCFASEAIDEITNQAAVDSNGNIYISEWWPIPPTDSRVRVVNRATQIIETAVGGGTGCPGAINNLGDGCIGTAASLNQPWGLAISTGGNVYVSDRSNSRIRMYSPNPPILFSDNDTIDGKEVVYYQGLDSNLYQSGWNWGFVWNQVTGNGTPWPTPSGQAFAGQVSLTNTYEIFYLAPFDANGDLGVEQLYRYKGMPFQQWYGGNLTGSLNRRQFDQPARSDTSIVAMTDSLGAANDDVVAYVGTDDHIHVLQWSPGPGWSVMDATAQAQAQGSVPNVAPGSKLSAGWFYTAFTLVGIEAIQYVGTDQHLHFLFRWNNDGVLTVWSDIDWFAKITGQVPPAAGSPLASDGSGAAYYIGTDSHVHQVGYTGYFPPTNWWGVDFSSPSGCGAPSAANGSPLVVHWQPSSKVYELFFLDASQDIRDNWEGAPGSWTCPSWTLQSSGGPPAAAGTPMSVTFTTDLSNTNDFFYLGADLHVHEFYGNGQEWYPLDVTAQSGAPPATP